MTRGGRYLVVKDDIFGAALIKGFATEADANAYAHELSERFTSLHFVVYTRARTYISGKSE